MSYGDTVFDNNQVFTAGKRETGKRMCYYRTSNYEVMSQLLTAFHRVEC